MSQFNLTFLRNIYFLFIVVLVAWFSVFKTGFITAVDIWTISEIFNHCFLVLPLSAYFIYQKRDALSEVHFTPNYWLLPILTGCLFVQTFGYVGDIQLLMHMATFASLPILIWMLIGNQAAKIILFPLVMMLFSIPVGEQLIPFLQELTTDLAVPLLELTQVPIYRNGLYLDIPEGRFLVAEACSGISFLITSIVFGCIYAYISFSQFHKQVIFVLVSIFVPILANAIRVYGIVLTGHLSDMEYAVGADHLIYGGVFYGIIIFILVLIGEQYRDLPIKAKHDEVSAENVAFMQTLNLKLILIVLVLFTGQHLWLQSLVKPDKENQVSGAVINAQKFFLQPHTQYSPWLPEFKGATAIEAGTFIYQNTKVDLFVAAYRSNDLSGELISSLNRLYSSDRWTLIKHYSSYFSDINKTVVLTHVISPQGKERIIAHWYEVSNKPFTSKVKTKLYATGLKIFGIDSVNKVVAFSLEKSEETPNSEELFSDVFSHYHQALDQLTSRHE